MKLNDKAKIATVQKHLAHTGVPINFERLSGSSERSIFYRMKESVEEAREWILFENNKFFCIYCLAFSAHKNQRFINGVEYVKGCRISDLIIRHETETHHTRANNFYKKLVSEETVESVQDKSEKWNALSAVIRLIIFMATNGEYLEMMIEYIYSGLHFNQIHSYVLHSS